MSNNEIGNGWGVFSFGAFFGFCICGLLIHIFPAPYRSDKPIQPDYEIEVVNGVIDTTFVYHKPEKK